MAKRYFPGMFNKHQGCPKTFAPWLVNFLLIGSRYWLSEETVGQPEFSVLLLQTIALMLIIFVLFPPLKHSILSVHPRLLDANKLKDMIQSAEDLTGKTFLMPESPPSFRLRVT